MTLNQFLRCTSCGDPERREDATVLCLACSDAAAFGANAAVAAAREYIDPKRLAYAIRRDDNPNDPDIWVDPHDVFSRAKAARLAEYMKHAP